MRNSLTKRNLNHLHYFTTLALCHPWWMVEVDTVNYRKDLLYLFYTKKRTRQQSFPIETLIHCDLVRILHRVCVFVWWRGFENSFVKNVRRGWLRNMDYKEQLRYLLGTRPQVLLCKTFPAVRSVRAKSESILWCFLTWEQQQTAKAERHCCCSSVTKTLSQKLFIGHD